MLQCNPSGRGQEGDKRRKVTDMECILEKKLLIEKQRMYMYILHSRECNKTLKEVCNSSFNNLHVRKVDLKTPNMEKHYL